MCPSCPGARGYRREAETSLEAIPGLHRPSPPPQRPAVTLAPPSTTSKLPLSPFVAGSVGPWSRGRLEQDPINVAGVPSTGAESLVPAAPAPPTQPRALAKAVWGLRSGVSTQLAPDGPLGGGQKPPHQWDPRQADQPLCTSFSSPLNGMPRASPWGAQRGPSSFAYRTKRGPQMVTFEVFYFNPANRSSTHRLQGPTTMMFREGLQGL